MAINLEEIKFRVDVMRQLSEQAAHKQYMDFLAASEQMADLIYVCLSEGMEARIAAQVSESFPTVFVEAAAMSEKEFSGLLIRWADKAGFLPTRQAPEYENKRGAYVYMLRRRDGVKFVVMVSKG